MKTARVIITKMDGTHTETHEFAQLNDALNYFIGFCDEHSLPYDELTIETGGVGYDYRIELEIILPLQVTAQVEIGKHFGL